MRVRFGIRGVVFFAPNVAVFVRRGVTEEQYEKVFAAVETLKLALRAVGWADWADRIVFEAS